MSSGTPAVPPIPVTTYEPHGSQWNIGNDDSAAAFTTQFPDNFLPSLEAFDLGVGLSAADEAFLAPDSFPLGVSSVETDLSGSSMAFDSSNSSFTSASRTQRLVDYFVRSVNPTNLMQPTQTEWMSACRRLTAMANESGILLSAICALSALHLHCTVGHDTFEEAFRYYRFASREISSSLDNGYANDRHLKQIFAAMFLMCYTEVRSLYKCEYELLRRKNED